MTYAKTDELVVEDNPRQQVDERDVSGEQGHDVRGVQDTQRVHVHPVRTHPQEAEHAASPHKRSCKITNPTST